MVKWGTALATACWLLLAGMGAPELNAQSTLQGVITDGETGHILEGANITLQEVNGDRFYGAATDRNGFYQINNILEATYAINITYVGYVAHTDTLALGDEPSVTMSLSLPPDDSLLDEVVVSPEGGAARREVGVQRISRADMRRVPTPAAGGDLASYLQAMPGVVATGDRGGHLYIRGGLPSQNMILMDGAMIYQPFHILGFFSAFPEELVSSTDFYAGGFGPEYVGRSSSVMDIHMRDGNRNRYRGSGSVSPFLADVMAEGPIVEGSSAWIASVRHSLIEHTSGTFMTEEQPLHFESQFLKVSQLTEDDTRCSALAMRTYDRGKLDFASDDRFDWSNLVLAGRCMFLPEGSSMFMNLDTGLSRFNNNMVTPGMSDLHARVSRFHLNATITQLLGDIRLDYGMHSFMKWMTYEMSELFHSPQGEYNDMFSFGFHGSTRIPISDRFRVTPGLAMTLYPGRYNTSFEPRIRANWNPFGRESEEISAAFGIYRQVLVGISDMRDASSVFTAWMPSPVGDSQMESRHALLGWQQELGGGFNLSVEGFYKWIRNQPVTVWSSIASFTTDLALADGTVHGADARLEFASPRFYGFLGYGYTWTEYESTQDHFGTWFGESVQSYHPPHDRRHQLQAMGSLDVGIVTLNARWQLGTGFPFTQPMGFDELHYFHEQLPDVRADYGTPRVIMERPYQGRLPTYHRMDVSVERSFTFPVGTVSLEAGAINSYNQTNLFYYDVYTHRRVDQLPIAPYVSIKFDTN